jgi:serine/threonine protein kinase
VLVLGKGPTVRSLGQILVPEPAHPSNPTLTPSGLVKLVDLGLARLVSGSAQKGPITPPGQFLGTLDYMAPAQCDNSHTIDIRNLPPTIRLSGSGRQGTQNVPNVPNVPVFCTNHYVPVGNPSNIVFLDLAK